MNRGELLGKLPPFRYSYELVKRSQTVDDIIIEIEAAHKCFKRDYEKIAFDFYYPDPVKIFKGLWSFCKGNIKYQEESEAKQTTMSPAGILELQQGDCKHYALFIGGVLCALNRSGVAIDWWFRFAGYGKARVPGHVFVVAKYEGREYWIDPVLQSFDFRLRPSVIIDKKFLTMPLYRVSGIDNEIDRVLNGYRVVRPYTGPDNNINYEGTANKYANIWTPYLGLDCYRDFCGDNTINAGPLAIELDAIIKTGPASNNRAPIPGDFVQWVYNESIRSWNFFYKDGVKPGFSGNKYLPSNWPRPVFTADGKLQFSPWVAVDEGNAEIHILTAWLQDIVNTTSAQGWPVKPRDVKEFSQQRRGDDFFNMERRERTNWLTAIGKAFESSINFVKDKVLTVVGFIPRNAFLGLIGINAFNWAKNLWDKIQAGQWDKIAKKWEQLGGNASKLRNTIEDNKDKPAILGNAIGAEPVTTSTAALLAAAAPIIAALLMFLDKDGKAREILASTRTFLQTKYPSVDWSGLDFLDQPGGVPLVWEGDPRYNENLGAYNPGTMPTGSNPLQNAIAFLSGNPLLSASLAAGVTYYFTRRQRRPWLMPVIVGGVVYFSLGQTGLGVVDQRREMVNAILQYNDSTGDTEEMKKRVRAIVPNMTNDELSTMYTVLTQFAANNQPVPEGSPLWRSLSAISSKYKIYA